MKSILKKINGWLFSFGLDGLKFFRAIKNLPYFFRSLFLIKRSLNASEVIKRNWPITTLYPQLTDFRDSGGTSSGHYFHMDLYVASKIFRIKPNNHLDIGSRIDGFVAHVACFMEVTVGDIRLNPYKIPNMNFMQVDLMKMPDNNINQFCSISCLHALEHFGLGRYGDSIDVLGYKKGFANIVKLLESEGILYFAVPIGPQRIEFNAHRVFNITTVLELASNEGLELIDFAYVDDKGKLYTGIALDEYDILRNFGCNFGCGIFTFKN